MKKIYITFIPSFFCFISLLLSACTTGEQLETTGSDNTGRLHHVRKKLYERTDTKVSLREHKGHEYFLDTLDLEAEEVDTLFFKTADVNLALLSKDLTAEHGKATRIVIKNNLKKYLFKSQTPIKLPKDSYISVAYLCNYRGISIKSRHSVKVYQFKVIEEKQTAIDKEQPMIFINKPMPIEKGAVVLDFILVNTSLTTEDNLVRVKIDGVDFFADKWVPFVIHGLKPGKHKIEVAIVTQDEQELDNYFSKDTREFILK